jgi:hypothetical protein
MKTIKFFVCCLVFISLFSCTKKKGKNDEFILNIEDNFTGIYLPLKFVNCLNDTKNFYTALNTDFVYNFLIVTNNAVLWYETSQDAYFKEADEYVSEYYKFISDNNKSIISFSNNEYIKIGNKINNVKSGDKIKDEIDIINTYIAEIVLDELFKNGLIYIENYMLGIPSVDIDNWNIPRFKIETFLSEYELKANLRLYDCADNEILYFIISNNRYHICKWNGDTIEIKWTLW